MPGVRGCCKALRADTHQQRGQVLAPVWDYPWPGFGNSVCLGRVICLETQIGRKWQSPLKPRGVTGHTARLGPAMQGSSEVSKTKRRPGRV